MDPNWCCVHYYYYWTSSLVVNDWLKTEGQTLWQWKKTFMNKVASGDKKFNIAERDFESAHSLPQLNWWVTGKWTLRDVIGLLGSPDWISQLVSWSQLGTNGSHVVQKIQESLRLACMLVKCTCRSCQRVGDHFLFFFFIYLFSHTPDWKVQFARVWT